MHENIFKNASSYQKFWTIYRFIQATGKILIVCRFSNHNFHKCFKLIKHEITNAYCHRIWAAATRMPTLLLPHLLLVTGDILEASSRTKIWIRTFTKTLTISFTTSWQAGKQDTNEMLSFIRACSCAVLIEFLRRPSLLLRKKFSAIFTVSITAGDGFVSDMWDCEKFFNSINLAGAVLVISEARQSFCSTILCSVSVLLEHWNAQQHGIACTKLHARKPQERYDEAV